ncbi:MAG: post-segregation antitoxin CcdA [Phenylobacterium sp.]|nr:MAG: post-segregation antitoxin CcdA [Phenylobacterium sp.]
MGKEPKIDPKLLAQAEDAGVPVDQVIDEALRRAVLQADKAGADARAAKWAEENAEAIADYNRRIREWGVFSAGFQTF